MVRNEFSVGAERAYASSWMLRRSSEGGGVA